MDELAAVDGILGATRDEIESLQLERLQSTLRHAYANNPSYKRSFDAARVRPEDLVSLADLRRFPFTTKADLREAYPFGFFAVPREQVARIHASSGTTGKPTVVGYTRNDLATWGSLVARSIRAAGGRAGMKVHIAYGYGLFTGGLGAHYGAEAAGCTVIPMSGGQTERQVQLIRDFAPDIIMVTPSYMLAILDEFNRQGVDPRSTSRGARECARRSNRHSASTPAISTACPRSWDRASPRNSPAPRRDRPSGKITSSWKSWIR
jgi:phenylacetate-CoA ligase